MFSPDPTGSSPTRPTGPADPFAFWRAWLRSPGGIGAVAPSGRALARTMARAALSAAGDGTVVELGAGTGAVTRALVDLGVDPSQLIVIEREAALARILHHRFPKLTIATRDACDLPAILADHGHASARVVVSSLPLLAMPRPVRAAIVDAVAAALEPGGRLVQFTYGPASPLGELAPGAGLAPRRYGRAWLNLPPATVWCYEQCADPAERGPLHPAANGPSS